MTDKPGITLREQRAHLGSYNPDSFVEDPGWDKKPARARGRKSPLALALLAAFAVLVLLRKFGLLHM